MAFLLVVASAPSIAGGRATELRLAEFIFDPVAGEPDLPQGWMAAPSSGPDLQLVQFDGPITDERLAEVRSAGLEPVAYVYPNSYLTWGRPADRTALDRSPSVRWSGAFAPAYRVQPQWRDMDAVVREVSVLLVGGPTAAKAVALLTALGAVPTGRRSVNERLEVAGFKMPGDLVRSAARVPGVVSVQLRPDDPGSRGEASAQLNAGNVDAGGVPVPGYPAWLSALGISGAGVTIAHVDEGADESHPDLAASIAPCTGASCSSVLSQHGTHTAGILVGDATSAFVDANGFLAGQGVAPGAMLVEQLYNPIARTTGGMLELMRESWNNGAIVSNNSWGRSRLTLGYDIHALLVDAGVRDVDPLRPGLQSLIYIQAIANGQGGTSSQGVPDDAKNILTVGATVALDLDGNPDMAPNNLSYISGHGPALDGRTIPHLVAPGCSVYSTWPLGVGADHGGMCGTSMAAAQVTGAVALFIEAYRNLGLGDPSPALVKSAILPVAHDLDGALDADGVVMGHRPDSRQGWGRLDLRAFVDPPDSSVIYEDQTRVFHATGQEWSRVVTPVDPAEPMRIMLAWTDAPGHGLGGATPAWNNDLDLVVDAGGASYLGNVFGPDGRSSIGGTADPANNAEAVFLSGLAAGEHVTLRVVAANINSDGVPGNGDETDQDFALTCYNCAFVPAFAISASPGLLEVCAPDEGIFDVTVKSLGGYTTPVDLDLTGVPAGALASFAVDPLALDSSTTLTLSNTAMATDGDFDLVLSGTTPEWSPAFELQLRLRQSPPGSPTLTAPLPGAVGVDPQPALSWNPVPWTDRYLVEVATDPAFDEIVYGAIDASTTHTVRNVLQQQTTYHWRIRARNNCGFGNVSAGGTFTTGSLTPLLLVDDDSNLPDVKSDFVNALDAIGASYDLWDIWDAHAGKEPDATTLARYEQIIWFTGEEEIYAGPDAVTEATLENWLDRAGCLMLSSADYILNGDFDRFVQERFGVAGVTEDTGQNTVEGQGSVFGVVGPFSLRNANPDYSDVLSPDATAEVAFVGDLGTAAVNKDAGYYRTFFSGFGLERLPGSSTGLDLVLDTFLDWCDELLTMDGDADGVPNGEDCQAGDPSVTGGPGQVNDLRLGDGHFTWSVPVGGSGALYDVLRSTNKIDFYNATCVATGIEGTFAHGDVADPAPGKVFFYLARARNACGQSSLGQNPDGTPRHGTACE